MEDLGLSDNSELMRVVSTTSHVPAQKEASLKRLGRKTLWVITGVLAPELVLFTASSQWRIAKNTTRELNQILERQQKADQDPRNPRPMSDQEIQATGSDRQRYE